MAGMRTRSDGTRRARGLTLCGDVKPLPRPQSLPLKRWDGLSRTCRDWDSLRRDPDIWERNGNCLVHLYAKGDSKRGPSFKLPFFSLISASCFPLMERFLVLEGLPSRSAADIEAWDQLHPRSTVELYIPPPPLADETEARHYHLAVRNFFAWVLGRPMVGEQLGSALVGLLRSMHEFRSATDANMDHLTRYLAQAGYLNMSEEPAYALAVLHLAETFHLKELYTQAFAHCVGMHERWYGTPGYEPTSSASRKLLRKARVGMNAMLLQTSDMLTNFLDEELTEANLAIPGGSHAHFERFRSFLMSFYTTKLGYYPPKSFSPGLLRTMAKDFEALFGLLVENDFFVSDMMPFTAVGGICSVQLVHSFDERYKLQPLGNPLPKLPKLNIENSFSFRRLVWLPFSERAAASQRQVTHAALVKASNWTENIFKNDLVRAYRRFEELSVMSPCKADKNEKLSAVDARKVRWIMVYAIHQILRRATKTPAEVQGDETSYHLAISMDNVSFPWQNLPTVPDLVQSQTDPVTDNEIVVDSGGIKKIEIKPDIDYLALVHQDQPSPLSNRSGSSSPNLSRSSSFSISLKRNSTIRRSFRKFRPGSISESRPVTPPPMYDEIIVQGYGDGTHGIAMEAEEGLVLKGSLAGRSDSTASSQTNTSSRSGTDSALYSMSSTIETLPSPLMTPSPSSGIAEKSLELELMLARWGPQDKAPARISLITRSASTTAVSHGAWKNGSWKNGSWKNDWKNDAWKSVSWKNDTSKKDSLKSDSWKSDAPKNDAPKDDAPKNDALKNDASKNDAWKNDAWKNDAWKNDAWKTATTEEQPIDDERKMSLEPKRSSSPKPLQRRYSLLPNMGRRRAGRSVPVLENSIDEEWWVRRRNSDEWSVMQAFMDSTKVKTDTNDAWAQYADLGGLTDMK